MSWKRVRWGGVAAMLGSALGIVIAPIITSAYSLSEQGGAEQAPPWEPVLSQSLDVLFSFASPEAVYATYGKLYFLVFLGLLLGLVGLYSLRSGHTGRLEEWGFRLSFVGLVLNLLGNLGDYWYRGGVVESTPDFIGFLVGTLLGLLILTIGYLMLGITLLRAGAGPRLGSWLLILSIPGFIVLGLLGFGNLPSMPALWFCFAWLVLGYYLWSHSGSNSTFHSR